MLFVGNWFPRDCWRHFTSLERVLQFFLAGGDPPAFRISRVINTLFSLLIWLFCEYTHAHKNRESKLTDSFLPSLCWSSLCAFTGPLRDTQTCLYYTLWFIIILKSALVKAHVQFLMFVQVLAKESNLCLIRPQNLFLYALRIIKMSWQTVNCHQSVTVHSAMWILLKVAYDQFSHLTIQAWLMECCWNGRPSGKFSYFSREHLKLSQLSPQ